MHPVAHANLTGLLQDQVLTPEALAFLEDLVRRFRPGLGALLRRREAEQARRDAGEPFVFLEETREVRRWEWTIAPIPADLQDRRVEITGPPEPKMVIHALNSGASGFMADFEDSLAPTWEQVLQGQRALQEAVRRRLVHEDPATGRRLTLGEKLAVLHVRPRGLHLPEVHLCLDGQPMPAALVDAGLFLFHNARELVARGSGPYLYLPKLEHHAEAGWWNEVFLYAQRALDLPIGTIRATVLIETLPAAFQMDEILYELRDHIVGLNAGRWDYIFSLIKARREDLTAVVPDRSAITMDQPGLQALSRLLVKTCHRRGAHAMGGMAAQIPRKDDPAANAAALDQVRLDKLREVHEGYDGTWVAHPGLVGVAREVFDAQMPGPHQKHRLLEEVRVTVADLLQVPQGPRTAAGVAEAVGVALAYLEAWLGGLGCVPLNHRMEDAATAEIARALLWQWRHHGVRLDDGTPVTAALLRQSLTEAVQERHQTLGAERFRQGHFLEAKGHLEALVLGETFIPFLTLPAYGDLVAEELMARVG